MPLALTYPGVYVQAIIQPSPPDSGIPTSTTAFIGRAAMGPVNQPIILNSWGDHQRFFGGLDRNSAVSYQVNAFFNNGGGQAIGVRLFYPDLDSPLVREALDTKVANWLEAARNAALKPAVKADAPPAKADSLTAGAGNESVITGAGNDTLTAGTDNDSVITGTGNDTLTAGAGNDSLTAASTSAEAATARQQAVDSLTAALQQAVGTDAWMLQKLVTEVSALDTATHTTATTIAEAIGGFAEVPTYTASIGINLINPVYDALQTVTETLQLQGDSMGVKGRPSALMAIANTVMSDYARGAANPALVAIKEAIAPKPTVPEMLVALGAAWPEALRKALPDALSASPDTNRLTALGLTDVNAAFNQGIVPAVAAVAGALTNTTDVTAALAAAKAALGSAPTTLSGLAKDAYASVATAVTDPEEPFLTVGDIAIAAGIRSGAWVQQNWPDTANLTLTAANPGSWGNNLSAVVDRQGITPAVAQLYNLNKADLFNLTVTYTDPFGLESVESFPAVTLNPNSDDRFLTHVLAQQSNFVRYAAPDSDGGTPTPPLAGAAGNGANGQDSEPLDITTYLGDQNQKTGLYALERTPIFNILCIPPDIDTGDTEPFVYQTAAEYCTQRNAMLIIDPPSAWSTEYNAGRTQNISLNDLGSFSADGGRSSAVYFPRLRAVDPLVNGAVRTVPNSGYIAGLWAQTDTQIGVWKAPAGLDAAINGIVGLELTMSDAENGMLNPQGINCLRTFPIGGSVVWGARTLRGADQLADEYNYVPVRRTLLYIMDWALQNTKWAVFQPNDESLWSGLRLQLGSFLTGLWKQGALFGTSADKAFFVNCDATTTTTADIDAGRVNVQIGFAPVRPAEFVVVTVQQIAMSAS